MGDGLQCQLSRSVITGIGAIIIKLLLLIRTQRLRRRRILMVYEEKLPSIERSVKIIDNQ